MAAYRTDKNRSRSRGEERLRREARASRRKGSSRGASSARGGSSADARVIHIPTPVVIAVGVLLLVGFFAAVGALERSCSREEAALPLSEPVQQPAPDPEVADFSRLPSGLPEADLAALQAVSDDRRIVDIVNNAQAYVDEFGEPQALKFFELAAEEPDAVDYVRNVISLYPSTASKPYEEALAKNAVPLLMQWDERWGYTSYCAGPLGRTGCCPTSLSMVYMGLTGRSDKTPAYMARLATEKGYAVDGEGTYGTFLTDMAPALGLQCAEFAPDASELVRQLRNGCPVIVNVGPGDFTDSGHFLVATGLADDGTVRINDPYSKSRSDVTWSADVLANQSICMYAFHV